MTLFRRWYGASPLHLLVLVVTFCIGGYAASRIYVSGGVWLSILVWFVLLRAWARRGAVARVPDRGPARFLPSFGAGAHRALADHVRIPAGLSLLLLLVYSR